jgi:hypothetical protein
MNPAIESGFLLRLLQVKVWHLQRRQEAGSSLDAPV